MPLTILLADDSMTAQNMGKKILTAAGYEVVAVSNGAAAVKKIAEHRPDLAVLDVYMPGYTGLEVCERLKSAQETNAMPVLLTVGKMEPFKPEEGSRVKADGLIIKPFEATDLLAAVQKLEEKLSVKGRVVATPAAADEIPEYERTIKITAPVIDEADESYQAWKAEAPEHAPGHSEDAVSPPVAVGMSATAAAPAFPAAAAFEDELAAPATHTTSSFTAPTEEIAPQEILPEAEAGALGGVKGLLSKAKGWFGGGSAEEAGAASPAEPAPLASAAETAAPAPEPLGHFESATAQRITEPLEPSAPAPEFAEKSAELAPAAAPAFPHDHNEDEWTTATKSPASSWAEPASPAWAVAETAESSAPAGAPEHSAKQVGALPSPALQQAHADFLAATGFEPTALEPTGFGPTAAAEVPAQAQTGADPALITDAAEMATAFPTKFGIEGAEPVHVGIASEFPQLYDDVVAHVAPESAPEPEVAAEVAHGAEEAAPVAAAAEIEAHSGAVKPEVVSDAEFNRRVAEALESGWKAEPAALEAHEHGVALHEEMRRQGEAAPQAELHSEPAHEEAESVPPVAAEPPAETTGASGHENAPDHELAAAMAAAVGAQLEPAGGQALAESGSKEGTGSLDQHTAMVADIVHRVTERLKPNLVSEIARELADELKRKRRE